MILPSHTEKPLKENFASARGSVSVTTQHQPFMLGLPLTSKIYFELVKYLNLFVVAVIHYLKYCNIGPCVFIG